MPSPFVREVIALDTVAKVAGGTRKFRVFGTVFTFYGTNRDNELEALVIERAKTIAGYDTAWESAREVDFVDSNDAIGLGFYRVETRIDDREPEITDVRYRWS